MHELPISTLYSRSGEPYLDGRCESTSVIGAAAFGVARTTLIGEPGNPSADDERAARIGRRPSLVDPLRSDDSLQSGQSVESVESGFCEPNYLKAADGDLTHSAMNGHLRSSRNFYVRGCNRPLPTTAFRRANDASLCLDPDTHGHNLGCGE